MTDLVDLVAAEIEAEGPLPFSRFMDLALYHPELGFYADGGAGRRRDFITSPEVGPLFGATVARAIDAWWDELGRPAVFTVVEAGAGPGTLARSVLRSKPACLDALRYVAVETSEAQRLRHPDTVISTAEMPDAVDTGVVLANELLDNLPFDILCHVEGRGWCEVRVDHLAGRLVERLVDATLPAPTDPAPDGRRIPVQRATARWLRRARASLRRGRVVVIDYAHPDRAGDTGWLRTYSAHGRAGSPLDEPGTKDITADVDLEALCAVAQPSLITDQSTWLRSHGIDLLVDQGRQYWDAHAGAPDLRALEMRSRTTEAQALLDPGGLGGFAVVEWSVGGPGASAGE